MPPIIYMSIYHLYWQGLKSRVECRGNEVFGEGDDLVWGEWMMMQSEKNVKRLKCLESAMLVMGAK